MRAKSDFPATRRINLEKSSTKNVRRCILSQFHNHLWIDTKIVEQIRTEVQIVGQNCWNSSVCYVLKTEKGIFKFGISSFSTHSPFFATKWASFLSGKDNMHKASCVLSRITENIWYHIRHAGFLPFSLEDQQDMVYLHQQPSWWLFLCHNYLWRSHESSWLPPKSE